MAQTLLSQAMTPGPVVPGPTIPQQIQSNVATAAGAGGDLPATLFMPLIGAPLAALQGLTGVTPGNISREALQGATSGWAKNILPSSFGTEVQSFRSDHPLYAFGANALGQYLNPANRLIATGAGVLGMGSKILAGAAGGAAAGALNAAGEAPAGEKLQGAETGAKWGGALGAIGGTIARLIEPSNNPTDTDRIQAGLRRALQMSDQNPEQLAKILSMTRDVESTPYYQSLDDANAQVRITPTIRAALATDAGERALRNARSALVGQVEVPDMQDPSVEQVPWRVMDVVKKNLDADLEFAKTQGRLAAGASPEAVGPQNPAERLDQKAVLGVRKALLGEVDQQLPDYAKGRAAWEKSSRTLMYLNMGKQAFLKMTPERLNQVMQETEANPADREAFTIGALGNLKDVSSKAAMNRPGFQAMRLDRPGAMQKLQMLAPDETTRESVLGLLEKEGANARALTEIRKLWGIGPILRTTGIMASESPAADALRTTVQPGSPQAAVVAGNAMRATPAALQAGTQLLQRLNSSSQSTPVAP